MNCWYLSTAKQHTDMFILLLPVLGFMFFIISWKCSIYLQFFFFVFLLAYLVLNTKKNFRHVHSQRVYRGQLLKSLPNNEILDWFEFRAFADDKINVTEKMKFIQGRMVNIVGKGENAGYQHFLFFPQCFQKLSFSGSSKVRIVVKG